jgi:peptide/nickel transport system permease protein
MAVVTTTSETVPRQRRPRHPIVQFARTQPTGTAGLIVITIMFLAGVFAEFVAPYDPLAIDFAAMLAGPSAEHWLGTDAFGRDVLSRIIYGARTALVVGVLSSALGSGIGAVIGVASAYFGGLIDTAIQRFMDIPSPSRSSCWRWRWWRCSANGPCSASTSI